MLSRTREAASGLSLDDEIAQHIDRIERKPLRVLDAGAGGAPRIKFPADAHITGIDIAEDALMSNADLDEKIVGDLQTYPLPPQAFDLIVCWDVLEHLGNPLAAVRNMTNALAANGLLVVGGPNVFSPKALVAKFTPQSFHLFVYRRLLHKPNAGEPGHPPFPTYMRFAVAPRRLARTGNELGFHTVMLKFYEGSLVNRLPMPLRLPWVILTQIAGLISFGARAGESDFCLVLRK